MVSPRQFIALAVILLATLVSVGVVHGLWTDRWPERNAGAAIQEMDSIPLSFGAWEGKGADEDAADAILDINKNSLTRRYVNHTDGTVASIYLTRGRPGPMVIKHLPTECYVSSGYKMVGQPKRYLSPSSEPNSPDEFWVATFKKSSDVLPIVVRVYWSWSATGQWQTPDRPRITFARYPMLYKLYVVQNLLSENDAFEGAPVHDFIKELTKEMRGSLFASVPR